METTKAPVNTPVPNLRHRLHARPLEVLDDWRLDPRLGHEGHLGVGRAELCRWPCADLVEVLLLLRGAIRQPVGDGEERIGGRGEGERRDTCMPSW